MRFEASCSAMWATAIPGRNVGVQRNKARQSQLIPPIGQYDTGAQEAYNGTKLLVCTQVTDDHGPTWGCVSPPGAILQCSLQTLHNGLSAAQNGAPDTGAPLDFAEMGLQKRSPWLAMDWYLLIHMARGHINRILQVSHDVHQG